VEADMTLFYFGIRCEGTLIEDEEGTEHVNLAAAMLEAVRGARSLMSAEVETGHLRLDQSIEIFDAQGQLLSVVGFEEALRIIGKSDAVVATAGPSL
jgi:hypothetical protein